MLIMVKNMKKANVLGTEYTINESNSSKDASLEGKDGYCDTSIKTCVIDEMSDTDVDAKKNLPEYKKVVIRHELIHAFLYESGLDCCACWSKNEEMVDWIAIQFPKLIQAFKEADAL